MKKSTDEGLKGIELRLKQKLRMKCEFVIKARFWCHQTENNL